MLPGYTYHLTHRCHDREFLLRFQPDRNTYREWLREGASHHGVPVLGYCVTSNHVHVVTCAEAPEPVSAMMRLAAGIHRADHRSCHGPPGPLQTRS